MLGTDLRDPPEQWPSTHLLVGLHRRTQVLHRALLCLGGRADMYIYFLGEMLGAHTYIYLLGQKGSMLGTDLSDPQGTQPSTHLLIGLHRRIQILHRALLRRNQVVAVDRGGHRRLGQARGDELQHRHLRCGILFKPASGGEIQRSTYNNYILKFWKFMNCSTATCAVASCSVQALGGEILCSTYKIAT